MADDLNIKDYDCLIPPGLLKAEVPLSQVSSDTITKCRQECANIIAGKDDRVIAVVGPCSIHDEKSALEYADLLKSKLDDWKNLVIVMRTYPEKPRTTTGWKGLINDPDLTQEHYNINKGLRLTRKILCDITSKGLPVGVELLDTISPQFLSDCISWGAIGARTTESQLHRELASGVSMPIGFKNGTDGGVGVAVDAMRAASCPHAFMGINSHGLAAIVKTTGNASVHVILRGGSVGPNYAAEHIASARAAISKARPEAHPAIMVDCSHGNSEKDHNNQPKVLDSVCEQLKKGDKSIVGVMVESHINAGKQSVPAEGPQALKYGVSITDACVDWSTTVRMLDNLNAAVGARRSA